MATIDIPDAQPDAHFSANGPIRPDTDSSAEFTDTDSGLIPRRC
ncbi:hypothetical protein [Cryobacterium sp. MLB-32]|nr:hypothetical protein [Cryobacterium sp. MLB-32]